MAQDVTEPSVPHANDPAWNKTSKNLQAAWGDTNLQTDKFICPISSKLSKHLILKDAAGRMNRPPDFCVM